MKALIFVTGSMSGATEVPGLAATPNHVMCFFMGQSRDLLMTPVSGPDAWPVTLGEA